HDHMFDPIPQADYYRLLSFFRNIKPYERPKFEGNSATYVPLAPHDMSSRWFSEQQALVKPLEQELKAAKDQAEKKRVQAELNRIRSKEAPFEWALAVREQGTKPPATHVLIRGNAGTPGDEVEPAFLSVLGGEKPQIAAPSKEASTSGRRLALARWLVDPKNPLTARVMANRVWKYHFGNGIVKTTSDFGRSGIPPTHPQLLDWLAAELIDSGWSIKHLHRVIMQSAAYRRSSRIDRNTRGASIDPGNDLLWRQNLRRLEAEAIRDTILAVSGSLNSEMEGRGFFPQLGAEVLAGASKPGLGWELSSEPDRQRRSVYMFVKRSMVAPALDTFDYANTVQPLGERPITTVAPQSLMLLNDDFVLAQAAAFADRLEREASHDRPRQIERAYQLALERMPSEHERRIAIDYVARQSKAFASLGSRLTFQPSVPFSLFNGYLRELKPSDFMSGPRDGWIYSRGRWQGEYQGIVKVDPDRGPFALWQGASLANGAVTADLTLHNASELAAILVRATAEGDVYRGYEVRLDPRAGTMSLRRHGADVTLLGEADMQIVTGVSIPVRIEYAGPRLRVWAGDASEPMLDITDPQPLGDAGQIGVRTWGAALTLDRFTVHDHGRELDVATAPLVDATSNASEPLVGWRYYDGLWSRRNDGGYAVAPSPGAKAIAEDVALGDGVVSAQVWLGSDKGDAGLLVRTNDATLGVDAVEAYNINLRHNVLRLGKHENNWRALVSVPVKIEPGRWHDVRVELAGPRIRVFLDNADEPQIDYVDPNPLPAGAVGLRTFNAPCAFRDLRVTTADAAWTADFAHVETPKSIAPARKSADRRALEAFCLLMFNLNELIYVD
ncbi:MAG TPA: DUF1553 domain-containing protein, partial [Pirellulales bacterium]|nr:DUF1553 domain-containing protein [Pirellulales bacterium]